MKKLPLVCLDGNCQGQFLSAILNESGVAEAYFVGGDLGFVPAYRNRPCNYIDEAHAQILIDRARAENRTTVQGTQSTPMSDSQKRCYTDSVDALVRYPHLQFYAQAPQTFSDTFGTKQSPRKIFRLDIGTVSHCQKKAGSQIDFAGVMDTIGRSRPLFHTALHPGGLLTGMLFSDFASRLPDVDHSRIAHATAHLSSGEGINFTADHPVAQNVLGEIGLDWGDQYARYCAVLTAEIKGDWSWLFKHKYDLIAQFPNDTQIIKAIARAAIELDEADEARAFLEILIGLSPGMFHFWLMAFSFFRKQRDEAAVVNQVNKAKAFFGEQRQLSQLLAYVLIERTMWAEAESYARDYHARTPDRYDALVPIMKVFVATGRTDEAREWGYRALELCDGNRMGELRSCLSLIPEIDWSAPDRKVAS